MGFSPKERVIAQIQHEETDFIPYTLGNIEGDVPERLDAYYGSNVWRSLIDDSIRIVPGPSAEMYVDETVKPLSTDIYGSTWRVDRRPTHLVEPALKQASLEGFNFPSMDVIFKSDWKERSLRAIEPIKDHFLVTGFSFGIFERTWALRGFDNALIDAAAEPDFYDELVEKITDHQLEIVDYLLQLPVDGILYSDDWGYQHGVLLGAKRWRKYLKPRIALLYARAHAAGKYVLNHCCGSIEEIIPDLIEIGLDVYESVQPEAKSNNPYELKRKYGKNITFWGGLGSQSTIPFGKPADIRSEISKLCHEMGRGGGYILSPAKTFQPETPTENAAAVVESFLLQSGVKLT
jgi:uroporphyrinogen decarboxylase